MRNNGENMTTVAFEKYTQIEVKNSDCSSPKRDEPLSPLSNIGLTFPHDCGVQFVEQKPQS